MVSHVGLYHWTTNYYTDMDSVMDIHYLEQTEVL